MKKLLDIIDNFQKGTICVLGDIMLNHYTYGLVNRISPEAPVPVVELAYEDYNLGGCGGVADNISSLGGRVFLFGIVGEDDQSKIIDSLIKERKIENMLISGKRPTTTKQRIVSQKHQMIRIDRESREPISKEQEDNVISKLNKIIDKTDVVIVSDYAKGFVTESLFTEIVKICKNNKKPLIVDPKYSFSKYKGATLITPNFDEFKKYGSIDCEKNPEKMAPYARDIIKKFGIENILVTMSENGMALFNSDFFHHIRAVKNGYDVIDVTGAGDTAIGVYALALSAGADYIQAMKLANLACGVVVTKFGAATCTKDEIIKIINENG